MPTLINLNQVTKTYASAEAQFSALKGIDLTIERGDSVALVGASGSGKSTLMNILGFLDQRTTGQYMFLGSDVSQLSLDELAELRNKKIGFVFQSFFLLSRMNALQNVMLPLHYSGATEAESKARALAMLDKVQMAAFAKHKPNQLSGGQQQRVAIARALVNEPDIILADEPTGSLDSQTGAEVMQLLTQLHHEAGRTLVIVTHDKIISQQCARVITMKDGMLVS